jgi:CheY-like chemotaxis protein
LQREVAEITRFGLRQLDRCKTMSWDLSLNGLTVLVVDDHADSRDLTATILRLAGASVSMAASGREALEQMSSRWDLIVTDISMPDGTGYDLIREVRRSGSQVPLIALTALDTGEHRRRIVSSGFARHLTKPLLPEYLIAAVSEVASSPRQQSPARVDEVTRWNAAPASVPSALRRDSTG